MLQKKSQKTYFLYFLFLQQSAEGNINEKKIDEKICLANFEISPKTIIRYHESEKKGAYFLNETEIPSFEFCLSFCCGTELCNLAVWDKEIGSCYIFNCGSASEFQCVFDPIETYMTGVLLDRQKIYENNNKQHNQPKKIEKEAKSHKKQLEQLKVSNLEKNCSKYEFACENRLECIAIYDTCSGIPQCSDKSDEKPELCKKKGTKQHLETYGREGELGAQHTEQKAIKSHFLANEKKKQLPKISEDDLKIKIPVVSLLILVTGVLLTFVIYVYVIQNMKNNNHRRNIFQKNNEKGDDYLVNGMYL